MVKSLLVASALFCLATVSYADSFLALSAASLPGSRPAMGVGVNSLRFLEPATAPCAKGVDGPTCAEANYQYAFGRGTTPAPLTDQDAGAELTGMMVRTTFATNRMESSFNRMGTAVDAPSTPGIGSDFFVDLTRGPAPAVTNIFNLGALPFAYVNLASANSASRAAPIPGSFVNLPAAVVFQIYTVGRCARRESGAGAESPQLCSDIVGSDLHSGALGSATELSSLSLEPPVPEPATLLLFGVGLLSIALRRAILEKRAHRNAAATFCGSQSRTPPRPVHYVVK